MSTTREEMPRPICVAIVIVRRDDRYLVRVRPPGGPMPGVHEFAGGKCEPGETPEIAARREAREEIGMDVTIRRLRCRFEHVYPHGHVDLSYFDAVPCPPEAEPASDSGFRWVHAAELPLLTFPPANEPVIDQLVREAAGRAARPADA